MSKLLNRNKKAWEKAILEMDLEEAMRLHEDGVDLEWRLSFDFPSHGASLTALLSACMMDWGKGALWLIEQGACIDARSEIDGTPLSFAVKGEMLGVVEALLERKPETINLLNGWDETPLHVAPLLSNEKSKTPMDLAEENASPELAHLFRAFQSEMERADLEDHTLNVPLTSASRRM